MSDLAPFVAAQLRDKVVDDLMEENKKLRDQVDNFQRVEITGPGGHPVHASGLFRDGSRGGVFWHVGVENVMESSISLFREDIEIHIGGVEYISLADGICYVYVDERDWDGDDRKEIKIVFADDFAKRTAIDVRIFGWPKVHWALIQQMDYATRGSDSPFDVIEALKTQVAVLFPEATVEFQLVSFGTRGVDRIIENLGIPPPSEAEIQDERRRSEVTNLIVNMLCGAGNEELGDPWQKTIRDIQYAFYLLGLEEVNEEMNEVLPKLIEMKTAKPDSKEFLTLIKSEYDVPDQDWHEEMLAEL